jgi:hypothetical protein
MKSAAMRQPERELVAIDEVAATKPHGARLEARSGDLPIQAL